MRRTEDPLLHALRSNKPARVVVVGSEGDEREVALRAGGGPRGLGRWQSAATTARALAGDDEGARVELRDEGGAVIAALALGADIDADEERVTLRTVEPTMPPPDQRDERILTLLVSAQRAALEEQRILIGPLMDGYRDLAAGFATYAAQVAQLVSVAATVRAEVSDASEATQGADRALVEMLSRLPLGPSNGAPKA